MIGVGKVKVHHLPGFDSPRHVRWSAGACDATHEASLHDMLSAYEPVRNAGVIAIKVTHLASNGATIQAVAVDLCWACICQGLAKLGLQDQT